MKCQESCRRAQSSPVDNDFNAGGGVIHPAYPWFHQWIDPMLTRKRSGSCSPEVVLLIAAIREDHFSREPARIIRGKKYGHARDVLWLADAAHRRTGDYLFLKLRFHDARRVRTLRFSSTGTESVNAEFS